MRIGLSGCALTTHYELGQALKETAGLLNRETVVIASGDLSHRLKYDGPYGYRKEGPEYDSRIMEIMGKGDFGALFDFTEDFCEKAGECGHRSFTVMAGALDKTKVEAERLSYEGPFGVGYGVCCYKVCGEDRERDFKGGKPTGLHRNPFRHPPLRCRGNYSQRRQRFLERPEICPRGARGARHAYHQCGRAG